MSEYDDFVDWFEEADMDEHDAFATEDDYFEDEEYDRELAYELNHYWNE